MPAVIPFIPLIAAGVGATGSIVSSEISSHAQEDALKKQQQAQQAAEQAAQQKALQQQDEFNKQAALRASPDAQEQTQGFLSPASFSQLVNQLAGISGSVGSTAENLGLNISGGNSGTPANTGGSGLSDTINYLFGSPQDDGSSALTSPQ